MKIIKTSLLLLLLVAFIQGKSQSIVVTYVAPAVDNCNAPPEAGTYAVVGTLNGKNQYSSNSTHFIEWDGSKWIFRSFTSLGGWTTIYTNSSATPFPPCTGWVATFGCFLPTFTGGCVDPLVATVTKTNVACNGGSTGVASVNVSGGTAPYTYSWSPSGGTGAIATGLAAGSYTCTVSDAASQSTNAVVTITQPSALVTSTAITNIICNGGSTGSATITASGGTAGYTYLWSSAQTTSVITGLTAGVRTCTVTDAKGCTSTKSVTITQPSALVTSTAIINVACNGGSTGSATITASGGTGAYTYLWSSAQTTSVITGLNASIRTCTVTDANGCTSVKSITISQPASALSTATAITNVLCNGGSTGSATITASGGTGAYTYLWSSAQTTSVITALTAGVKTCTVTDANNCTTTNSVTIMQPSALVVTASASNPTICAGSSSTLTANASGGTSTITYTWVSGPTSNIYVVNPVSPTTYTVNIKDGNNCANSATVSVSANSCVPASALNFDGTNDYINCGNTMSATFATSNKITVEAWIKPSSTSGNGCIIGNYSTSPASSMQFLLRRDGVSYTFWTDVGTGFSNVTSVATVTTNVWQHVAGTWDGSTMSIYVNGVLSGTASKAGTNLLASNTNQIWIGGNNMAEKFAGNIDEVRIWNTTRTQCEINSYKNCEIPTTATGLLANYHFNQGLDASANPTVTILTDASGNSNTGTLNGFALTGTTSNWVAPGGVTTGSTTPANLAITVGATVSNSVICNGNSTILSGTGANTYIWTGGVSNGIAFSPTITTNYTVTGTNTLSGCTNTAVASVTVNNCAPGAALNLDGSNDLVNLGNAITSSLSGGTKVTAEAWVKPSSLSGLGCIVGNYNTGAGTMQIMLRRNGGSFYEFWIGNGASWYNTNSVATPSLNTWQHIAGTWDGSVASIYVNGVLSGTTTPALATLGNASNNPVWIGANIINENFTGDVDEIRIWNRALCKGEIQNNMNGEIPASATGLLANYHFNQGLATDNNSAINTLTDASGNSNTGTLTNMSLNGTTSNWSAPGAVSGSVTPFVAPSIVVNSGAICSGQSFTVTPIGASTYTVQGGNAVVNPSSNATYTVVGSTNGCLSNIVSSSVTVNSLPIISVNSGTICTGQSFTMTPSGANTYTYSSGSDIVTPTADATYSINGTDANGCVSNVDAVSSVTVNSLPSIFVNSGAICAGESFTIVPSGASTYTYSSGTDVVTPSANITYSVSGTDVNGCVSNVDAVSSVTVNALPTLIAVTTNTLLCTGETATLSVMGASTYTWSTTENTTDIVVTPTIQTTYTVDGTDVNGCSNSTTITQDVSLCTSIVTLSNNNSAINIYPNPNNGSLVLELTAASIVTVTNALGQVVISEAFEAGKHNLDIHNEANGVYFVKVYENNKQQIMKVIKE